MKLSLIESCAKPPKGVYEIRVPLHTIGVLTQMRARMSEVGLEDLSASIKEIGQHSPGLVVALGESEASKYLGSINKMWGTTYSLSEFEPVYLEEKEGSYYFFMAAGHRRYRATKMAGLDLFYCRLHFEKTFSDALLMQYHENLHEQVPPDNEARFISLFWRNAKESESKLTLASFARSLGKRPDVVRKMIRFTVLPTKVQELVLPGNEYKKGIAFSILCELARLQEAMIEKKTGFTEQELLHLVYVLITQYRTAKATAAWVSEQIQNLNGQGDMFGLSVPDVLNGARKTVGSGYEYSLRLGFEHLRVVSRFHDEAGVPKVASGSAVSAVERTARLLGELTPKIIEGIRGGRGALKARRALARSGDE